MVVETALCALWPVWRERNLGAMPIHMGTGARTLAFPMTPAGRRDGTHCRYRGRRRSPNDSWPAPTRMRSWGRDRRSLAHADRCRCAPPHATRRRRVRPGCLLASRLVPCVLLHPGRRRDTSGSRRARGRSGGRPALQRCWARDRAARSAPRRSRQVSLGRARSPARGCGRRRSQCLARCRAWPVPRGGRSAIPAKRPTRSRGIPSAAGSWL